PTNFDGIGVGFRYVAVPRLTVRAGLGLDRNTVETELPNSTTEDNSNTLALELGAEYMMFQSGPVGVYGGGILQFATSSTEPEGSDGTETTAFTIAAVFGVNYFLLENLALGAEYRLGFTQSQTENKDSDITTTDSTLGTGAVGFILSFWFE
ncbi:MAG: outer membrane beta-barrel protein, partial [Myxococcota bacterium]